MPVDQETVWRNAVNEEDDPDMLGTELTEAERINNAIGDQGMTHAAMYKAHTFDRVECHDHAGNCCPAGCHDVAEDQFTHYARVAHPVGARLTEAELAEVREAQGSMRQMVPLGFGASGRVHR